MKLICLILSMHCLALSGAAQMGGVDVRFIPDSSMLALQFDLQKLLAYEKMGSKNLETIARYLKKETSLDLMMMKSLTFQFCEGEDKSEFDDDTFGLIMTFSRPINRDAFLEKIEFDFTEAEYEGKKYYRSDSRYTPSVYIPVDKKTIVMALTPTLEKMIGRKSGNGIVGSLMNSADPGAEVKLAFAGNDIYRNMLSEIASEIPFKPFDIEKVFGEAKSAVMSVNIKSSTPIFMEIGCASETGAKVLAEKFKLLVDLGKSTIPIGREGILTQKKALEEAAPDEDRTSLKLRLNSLDISLKTMDFSEKILESLESVSQTKKVIVKAKIMGGLKSQIGIVSEIMAAQVAAMEAFELELDADDLEDIPDLDDIPDFEIDQAVEIK